MRIGIPRALLYYHYYPLWQTFWQELGAEVVTSPPTTKEILDEGVLVAVAEACLPVKVFYGHAFHLAPQVEFLFVPRIVSAQPGTYICPKFMGLPDMLRHSGKRCPPLLTPTLDARSGSRAWERAFLSTGRVLGFGVKECRSAWRQAVTAQARYVARLQEGLTPLDVLDNIPSGEKPGVARILLLGHPYNTFDRFVSMELVTRLRRRGYQVVTPEMLPCQLIEREARRLPKSLFWSLGRSLMGAGGYFMRAGGVVGIVHVVSFGCGPDSLVGELLERQAHRHGRLPFLLLTLDEHTGEGGLVTRLEAFLDMIEWRSVS